MSMLIKMHRDDIDCLVDNLPSDSSLRHKLSSGLFVRPNAPPIELESPAFVCNEVEARELLRLALEYCSHEAIVEIQSGMKLCGLF